MILILYKYLLIRGANTLQQLEMNKSLGQFSQIQKIRDDFRKEIRRRDIDRRFTQKRKQLLQQLKAENLGSNNNKLNHDLRSSQQKYNQIYSKFKYNPLSLTKENISELVHISTNQSGSRIIMDGSLQLLNFIIHEYIFKENYAESDQQDWVFMILNNILTVCNSNSPYDDITRNVQINALTTSQPFILKLFSIILDSNSKTIKQIATTVLFCIIYNNEPNFVNMLITNPKYSMISLFFNQMQSEPQKDLIIQTLRCYYLAIKKLNFPNLQQLGKMRKYILMVIRNSNCLQLTILGVICLTSLLKCLPNQIQVVSSSKIIFTIFIQTLSLNNTRLAIHALKIASYMLGKNNEQQIKKIIEFLQKALEKFGNSELQTYIFKIFYDLLVTYNYSADKIVDNHKSLITKMIELFQSNIINKSTLIQLSYCLCTLVAKSQKLDFQTSNNIKQRLRFIIDNVEFDEDTRKFLEQSLCFIDSNYEMNDA